MKIKYGTALMGTMAILIAGTVTHARAGEDVGTAAKNTAGDVSTAGKKSATWTKRQGRKVGGSDSATKDAQDRASNAKDNSENDATKAKNRAQENQ